mmetsp:Transcript_9277/g.21558  ORF Transcript_9277/g.21558 Transcript_9277/m.21558 type:complete len:291 (-) Transcript_9277:138-1010(-)
MAVSKELDTRLRSSRPTSPYPVDCIDTSFGLNMSSGIAGACSSACRSSRCTASTSVAPGLTRSRASTPLMSWARPIEPTCVAGGKAHFCFTNAAVPSSGKRSCTDGVVRGASGVSGSRGGARALDMRKLGRNGCTNCSVRLSSVYVSSPADVSNSTTNRPAPSSMASKHATTALPTESSKLSGSGCGLPVIAAPGRATPAAAISAGVCPAAACAACSIADSTLLGSRTFSPSSRSTDPERIESNCCLSAAARSFRLARSRSNEERTGSDSSRCESGSSACTLTLLLSGVR